MIKLSEFLKDCNYELQPQRVKLIRHCSGEEDIEALRGTPWFEVYQRYQSKPIFDGCDQIISFIGEEKFASRFVGVYDVGPRCAAIEAPLPIECPYSNWDKAGHYFYSLNKRDGFEELEDRLIIDWGNNPVQWAQWFTERDILELRPKSRTLPPFRDYLRINLPYKKLTDLFAHPSAHTDWQSALSAVGGIYLIVAEDGRQYVGSATGKGGLWQRWKEYAKSGHGNNKLLIDLCNQNIGYPEKFQFSILETFSRSVTRNEGIYLENLLKIKLGTRAFGLNGESVKNPV